ncbi:MAG: PfkB family carbohydrate kinase [Planctomycetes bacterium]|nr:PfkB family carbohydrate kinase [Planctomycetota bacterium]
MKALIFGTILFDIFPDGVFIGGCSTNVASHCGLLGAETTHLSRIGDDELGQIALRHFADVGVDTSFVTVDPVHGTGRVDVTLNPAGQPEYVLSMDSAYDYICLDDAQIRAIVDANYDFVYFGTVDQRGAVSAETLGHLLEAGSFKQVFCDINLRENCFTPESVERSLHAATILKLNEDELNRIPDILGLSYTGPSYDESGKAEALRRDFSIPLIIVTKSERGATAYSEDGMLHRAGEPVTVQDAVGAGDGFSAAFILKYIQDGDIAAALDAGNLLGGYVASKKGAVPVEDDYPRRLVAR